MAAFFSSPVVVLINESMHVVEIKESREYSPPGSYGKIISVPSDSTVRIKAKDFRNRCQDSYRGSTLKIVVDGEVKKRALSPQKLIDYEEIIFTVDAHNILQISGRPRPKPNNSWSLGGRLPFFKKTERVRMPLEDI